MAKVLQFPTNAVAETNLSDITTILFETLVKPKTSNAGDFIEGKHTDSTGARYFYRKNCVSFPQIHLAKISDEMLNRILKTKRYIRNDEERKFLMQAIELYESGVWIDDGGDNMSFGSIEVHGNNYYYSVIEKNKYVGFRPQRWHYFDSSSHHCEWPVLKLYADFRIFKDRVEAVTMVILSCCYDTVRLQDDIGYLPLINGVKPKISCASMEVTRERKRNLKAKKKAEAEQQKIAEAQQEWAKRKLTD